VRGEVGTARAQRAALPRERQLRPDAVGGGSEESPLVERVQAGEGAEALRAGRLDRCAQPSDDCVGDAERDARGGVGALLPQGPKSMAGGGRGPGQRREVSRCNGVSMKKTKAMTLRLAADQAAALEKVADVDGVPVSQAVRDAIERHIEERRRDPEFGKRLREYAEQHREILDLLAR
jgi:predicted DNA-binding protein